jgi:hypothetical protein
MCFFGVPTGRRIPTKTRHRFRQREGEGRKGGGQSCFRGLLGIGARMLTDCLHC